MTIGVWIMSDLHGEFLAGGPAGTDPASFPTPENAGDIDRVDCAIQNARKLASRMSMDRLVTRACLTLLGHNRPQYLGLSATTLSSSFR